MSIVNRVKHITIFSLIVCVLISVVCVLIYAVPKVKYYLEKNERYEEKIRNDTYTQNITDQLTQNGFCIMGEVFDFDWDVAYVISENYLGEEQLAKKIGVDVNIPHVDSDNTRRIAFLKDNQLVYVHYQEDIHIINEGVRIKKDATLKKDIQNKNILTAYFIEMEIDNFYDSEHPIKLDFAYYNYIESNPDVIISEHSIGDYEFILDNSCKQIIRQKKDGSEKASIFYREKIEKYRLINAYQIEVEGYKEIISTIDWLKQHEERQGYIK